MRCHSRSLFAVPVGVAALGLLAACDPHDTVPPARPKVMHITANAGRPMPALATADSEAPRSADDKLIDDAISAEFESDDGLAPMHIAVATQAGRVTLRGSAPDSAARDRAATLARGVAGVRDVNNELIVAARV